VNPMTRYRVSVPVERIRCVFPCLVALTVAAGSVPLLPTVVAAEGDANGDRIVDVRDLQFVIAAVLRGGNGAAMADVNGDGQVDIRDFQRILEQAQASDARVPPVPERRGEAAVLALMRFHEPGVPASIRSNVLITLGKRVATAALRARGVPLSIFSAKEERYYYRLTPNAPPAWDPCAC